MAPCSHAELNYLGFGSSIGRHCDMINLTGIVLYKVGNILFFLVPYIALRIVG
jgi:hypothetical protein